MSRERGIPGSGVGRAVLLRVARFGEGGTGTCEEPPALQWGEPGRGR